MTIVAVWRKVLTVTDHWNIGITASVSGRHKNTCPSLFLFILFMVYLTALPVSQTIRSSMVGWLVNKKFWEELIALFPWYDTGHVENDASNNSTISCVLFTAVTFPPSHCLATMGGILPSRCLATIMGYLPNFYRTEPLPSNDRGLHIQTHRLIGGIF
jgi:hypothetical protein